MPNEKSFFDKRYEINIVTKTNLTMILVIKIVSAILSIVAVIMGVKQGFAMCASKPEMLEMFSKWGFTKSAVLINGIVTILSALLILFPKTFIWGNFLMAVGILMIICFQLANKDLNGAVVEIPFLLLNLLLIYLKHPLNINH